MRTDSDYNHTVTSGWSTSEDLVNVTQAFPRFWPSSCEDTEHDVIVRMPPKRRYVQPAVLFLPLALWRWVRRRLCG
jgi:hypothetical protein